MKVEDDDMERIIKGEKGGERESRPPSPRGRKKATTFFTMDCIGRSKICL